ncbi:Stress response protein YsnF [Bacillus sp. THAF10]|uniref:general stress protein n=1 Tax=Bacillus sp. THAF10 TaxID=2587848 RepID=UPI001267D99C|nr:general stress protein [Bacillus sp. THAF10]QFT87323.1 Stress response protein YsnF [Bacillus sp. THAF10]
MKTILGVYDSDKKARNVVEGLIVQGYHAEEIVVVALDNNVSHDYPIGTRLERIEAEQEDSVMDKLKHTFIPDGAQIPKGVGNRLAKLGLSDREAPMYATDIENGRIVVLVNKKSSKEARTVTPTP